MPDGGAAVPAGEATETAEVAVPAGDATKPAEAAVPVGEATKPAEAPGTPEGENDRVVYKGGTITRKANMFKVHIAKKFSRSGKECDVHKMFAGKSNDAQAFAAAKVYIDQRVD